MKGFAPQPSARSADVDCGGLADAMVSLTQCGGTAAALLISAHSLRSSLRFPTLGAKPDEGFVPRAWLNTFILHPSCFILGLIFSLAFKPIPAQAFTHSGFKLVRWDAVRPLSATAAECGCRFSAHAEFTAAIAGSPVIQ